MKGSFMFCLLAICWLGLCIASIMNMPANYQHLFTIASFFQMATCCVRAVELYKKSN